MSIDPTSTADDLAPWFHNLHLPDGTQTNPTHFLGDFPAYKWRAIAPAIPDDLRGWRALDIGCNAGFYAIELAKRGASVVGIDCNGHYLRQASWAASRFGLADRLEFRQAQVYELARWDERFDLVLFLGVFYHLRYPMLGLDIVAEKVDRLLVFQTLSKPQPGRIETPYDFDLRTRERMADPRWPSLAFVEHRFQGDCTNWWVPNDAAVEAMLRSAGLRARRAGADESWVAEPDPERPSCMRTWNRDEYAAALRLDESSRRRAG